MAPGLPPGPIPAGAPLVNVPLALETPENQITFQASLLVPVSDYFLRVAPARDAAGLARSAAKESVEVARQRGVADARLAYYAWVRARLGVIVAEKAAEQAKAHLADVKAALAAGTASQADLLRLESQIAKSDLLVTSSRNLSLLAEEQLKTHMHLTTATPLRIGEDIREPARDGALPPLAALWAKALADRPELAAFDRAQAARERAVSVERAGYGPRLDLFANAQYSNPNPRVFPARDEFEPSWDAGAQLTWTLSDVPAAAARVRSAEARAVATRSERTLLVDRIRLEVLTARQASEEARVARDSTARGLAAAEESYRTRHLLFQNGRATAVELIDAETDLTRARLEALGARIDGRAAEVRLAYALGKPVCLTAEDGGRTLPRSLPRCP
jgi:outer membrane protein TolC